tara:strand:- start:187 stop:801 length:615 start_codon:yes stop_codon:yes gene_type:complete
MAFGVADNCSLGDLGAITSGSPEATSTPTSEVALAADCADYSPNGGNISLWASFKCPTQSQMMSGVVIDSEPEDDSFNVSNSTSYLDDAVTMDSPSTYSVGSKFMSRCWNSLNSTWIGNRWDGFDVGGNNVISYVTTSNTEPLSSDFRIGFNGNNTGIDSCYIRQSLSGNSAWRRFFGSDSATDWMGRVTVNINRQSGGGGGGL